MAQPQAKLAIELARKAGVKIPGRDKLDQLIKNANDATTELGNINISSMGLEDLTKEQMEQFSDRQDEFRVSEKDAKELAKAAREDKLEKDAFENINRYAAQQRRKEEMTQKERANIAAAKAKADARAAQLFAQAQQQASDDGGSDVGSGEQSVSDQASVADTQGGMFTAKGSLITRKKPKPKKMKRGGLASK
jgi:hypothetical protein